MKFTATLLRHQYLCPYLRFVTYEARQPLPMFGRRRRFGTVIHEAIAEYERQGRSLDAALAVLDERAAELGDEKLAEARAILEWRHTERSREGGRPIMIEGPLSTSILGHRLDVRVDRVDVAGSDLVLVEVKSGKRADIDLVRAQLAVLAYAVYRLFGRAPQAWKLELLGARRMIEIPSVTAPQELASFTANLARQVLEGRREPEPYDPSFCRRCPASSKGWAGAIRLRLTRRSTSAVTSWTCGRCRRLARFASRPRQRQLTAGCCSTS